MAGATVGAANGRRADPGYASVRQLLAVCMEIFVRDPPSPPRDLSALTSVGSNATTPPPAHPAARP